MKKILSFITAVSLSFSFVACDALFDNLEGDKSKLDGEYLASSEAGLSRMMATLYASLPMGAFAEGDKATDNASDTHSAGVYNSTPSFGWNYGTIRNANVLIKTVEDAFEAGTISEELCKTYVAEARFVRAYYYFGMVRSLGGVPIVTEPLDDKYDGGENAGLYIPRSTEKETWDFVLDEFQAAADALPEVRTDGPYRANKWAALGLKARAALYAASVSKYWKDAEIPSCDPVNEELTFMKADYAKDYYDQCITACDAIIKSGNFSLYNPTPANVDAAVTGLTELFLAKQDCEWIFGRSFDSGNVGATNGIDLKNSPNQTAFTAQTGVWKFGCYNVNADVADLYDNYDEKGGRVDGTLVTRTDGNETEWLTKVYDTYKKANTAADAIPFKVYDKLSDPFANKDARFQAWVIYPGMNFRGTDIMIQGGLWDSKGLQLCGAVEDNIKIGEDTYYMYGAKELMDFSGFHLRGDANKGSYYTTGFGLRKFLDPKAPVQYSLNPWYDVRYTEILLTYCEAIVERDGENAGDAKKHLNAIRRRAAFKDEVDATLENVLKERRLELMFEDDRAATLHRRRDFYRPGSKQTNEMRTHAIIPILYGKDGKQQYVFMRAYMFADDLDVRPEPSKLEPKNYYGGISNYEINKITPNPSQVL